MNDIKPDTLDVLATAVYLAAQELAEAHPQPNGDSVEIWKKMLLQQAIKMQDNMSPQERAAMLIMPLLIWR